MTGRSRRKPAEPRKVVLTDPNAIKALAHPARLAVVDELFSGRELTATECGEIAGLSASAMSYHLRALERAGIVERAEPTGDGRERPWRAAGSSLDVSSTFDSPLAATATATLAASVVDRLRTQFLSWLTASGTEDPRWRDASGIGDARVWVDIDEAEELGRVMEEALDRYRGRTAADSPEGARRVRVAVVLFPTDRG